jgi:hypothetical membrane protein
MAQPERALRSSLPAEAITFPAAFTRRVVIGALLWTLSVAFFMTQAIAQAAFSPPFDLATNLISDLGNTACTPDLCSPLHGLVNATFVIVGVLHVAGAFATYEAWPRRSLSPVGLGLIAVAGCGLIMAGLAPENEQGGLHAVGALAGLISLNLAMLSLGWAILEARRWLGRLAWGAGIVGLVGLALFLTGASGLPDGAAERLADYPGAAMVVVFGVYLLAAAAAERT